MRIISAEIRQFRNIHQMDLEFHPDTNLIQGENAQGKTSVLETFAYSSVGSSHRATHDRELLSHGEDFSVMKCLVESHEREYELEVQLRRGKRRRLLRNQVPVGKMQAFSDVFQTVMFCPEDLVLVRGASLLRRRFLDRAIAQLRPQYGRAMEEYKRLYQHKLRILKHPSPDFLQTLPDFNVRMAQTGTMMIHYRAHFIKRLQEVVPTIHHDFSGGKEDISLVYQTVSTVVDPLVGEQGIFQQVMAHQESHYQAELASGKILTGPHKDDLALFIQGQNAKLYASQGQTRTLALSLKLGERDIFYKETGEYPVLLLDDVLSELDRSRQEFVLHRIKTGQVFITSCEDEMFLQLREGAKFSLRDGAVVDSVLSPSLDMGSQEKDSEERSKASCEVNLRDDVNWSEDSFENTLEEEVSETLSQSVDMDSQEKDSEERSKASCEVNLRDDVNWSEDSFENTLEEEVSETLSQSMDMGSQEKDSEERSKASCEVNLRDDVNRSEDSFENTLEEEVSETLSQSMDMVSQGKDSEVFSLSEDMASQEKDSVEPSGRQEDGKDSSVVAEIAEQE